MGGRRNVEMLTGGVLIRWGVDESISSGSTSVDFRLLFRQSATDDRDGTKAEGKYFNDGI